MCPRPQGTASEGLANPGEELYDIVRYFGERKKIFNIHFRNILGGLHDFQEVRHPQSPHAGVAQPARKPPHVRWFRIAIEVQVTEHMQSSDAIAYRADLGYSVPAGMAR